MTTNQDNSVQDPQSADAGKTKAVAACCPASEQASCCEPSAKAACCGSRASVEGAIIASCGCKP
jgi:hypothetical protein